MLILLSLFSRIFISQTNVLDSNTNLRIGSKGIEFIGSDLLFERVSFAAFYQTKNIELSGFGSISYNNTINQPFDYNYKRYIGLGLSFYVKEISQINLFPSINYRYGEYLKSKYISLPISNPGSQKGYYEDKVFYYNSIQMGSNISIYFPPFMMLKISGNSGLLISNEFDEIDIILGASLGIQIRL